MKKLIVKEEGKEEFWRQISAIRPSCANTNKEKKKGGDPMTSLKEINLSFPLSYLETDFLYVVLAILDPAV